MKKILGPLFTTLFLLGMTMSLQAQTTGMNYQAVARDGSGALMTNTNINLEFQVVEGAIPGTVVYAEDATATTNAFGLFTVVIGEGTPTTSTYDQINWAADEHYLIVEVNGAKVDTMRFQSVPYSEVATGMELEDLQGVSGTSSPSSGDVLQYDGSNWTAAGLTSPWTVAGSTISNATGNKVFVNRTSGITGSEYFGVTSPTTGNAYGGMYVETQSETGRPFYGYAADGTAFSWTYWDGSDSTWKLYNGGTQFSVTRDTKVGIGTADPDHSLDIRHDFGPGANLGNGLKIHHVSGSGNEYYKFYVASGGSMSLYHNTDYVGNWNGTTGAYSATSDARLKKNVSVYGEVLPKVMQLQAKTYHYTRNDDSDRRSLGFIAQEVEPLFPHVVYQDGEADQVEDPYYSIDYAGFSVIAIKAIQEQQEVIEQQQRTIDELVNRLEALEAKIQE